MAIDDPVPAVNAAPADRLEEIREQLSRIETALQRILDAVTGSTSSGHGLGH